MTTSKMTVKTTFLLTRLSKGTQILKELKDWRSAALLTATLDPISPAQPGVATAQGNYSSATWTGMEASLGQGHPTTTTEKPIADSFWDWGLGFFGAFTLQPALKQDLRNSLFAYIIMLRLITDIGRWISLPNPPAKEMKFMAMKIDRVYASPGWSSTAPNRPNTRYGGGSPVCTNAMRVSDTTAWEQRESFLRLDLTPAESSRCLRLGG